MSDTRMKPRIVTYEAPKRSRGRPRYVEFQDVNPFRPLAWRWERASSLIESKRPLTSRQDDPWTLRAARYVRAVNRCQTDGQRAAIHRRYDDIVAAHRLYKEGGVSRWLAEARLLARQPLAEVAESLSLPLSALEAFEALFFCVIDRLDATGFILNRTMRKVVRWEVREEDQDLLLRYFAYFGGPLVLQVVAQYILSPSVDPAALPESERELRENVRRCIKVLTMPINNNTVGKLFALYVAMLKAQAVSQTHNGEEGLTADAILGEAFARFDADQPWPSVCEVA